MCKLCTPPAKINTRNCWRYITTKCCIWNVLEVNVVNLFPRSHGSISSHVWHFLVTSWVWSNRIAITRPLSLVNLRDFSSMWTWEETNACETFSSKKFFVTRTAPVLSVAYQHSISLAKPNNNKIHYLEKKS